VQPRAGPGPQPEHDRFDVRRAERREIDVVFEPWQDVAFQLIQIAPVAAGHPLDELAERHLPPVIHFEVCIGNFSIRQVHAGLDEKVRVLSREVLRSPVRHGRPRARGAFQNDRSSSSTIARLERGPVERFHRGNWLSSRAVGAAGRLFVTLHRAV